MLHRKWRKKQEHTTAEINTDEETRFKKRLQIQQQDYKTLWDDEVSESKMIKATILFKIP